RSGDHLVCLWKPDAPLPNGHSGWQRSIDEFVVDNRRVTGVAGTPALIQSRFGSKGDFELVVPLAAGGLVHYRRDNDHANRWSEVGVFGTEIGQVDAVSLIQSNFSQTGIGPGNLEAVARSGDRLIYFWYPDDRSGWQPSRNEFVVDGRSVSGVAGT